MESSPELPRQQSQACCELRSRYCALDRFARTCCGGYKLLSARSVEAADPDARRSGLAKMNLFVVGAQRHGFVVFALQYFQPGGRTKMQAFEEFEELAILFVHANNF